MFINKTVFKKLLKVAYNDKCLRIGDVNGDIVVSAGYWKIWCREKHMPNWFKAAVIELVGELPDEGTVVEYGKKEPPQQVITESIEYDFRTLYMERKIPYTVTPIIFGQYYDAVHFLQNKETKGITALSEDLYRMIDFSNMEVGENRPAGPSSDVRGDKFYWMNEFCGLELCGAYLHDAKTIQTARLLSEIDFEEGK